MSKPFGNETTLPPTQWHPEPSFRGTYSVLSSCVLTILLCVWTALHLGLPEHKQEHRQTMRKLGWLIMGLIAPEMVAWNAWEQRRKVTQLTLEMSWLGILYTPTSTKPTLGTRLETLFRFSWLRHLWRKFKIMLFLEPDDLDYSSESVWPAKSREGRIAHAWTDIHSWYAIMGGFAFDTTSSDQPFLPHGCERMTLTTDGIIALAKYWPTLMPNISRADIEDKSKSDALIKVITCWQATWFCVQCITRLAQGLSVSLLELNVFGHAICTLLIYMIWWDKPKDIREPTKLSGGEYNSVAATLCTLSRVGQPVVNRPGRPAGSAHTFGAYWSLVEDTEHAHIPPESLQAAVYKVRDIIEPHCLEIDGKYWRIDYDVRSNEYEVDQCIPLDNEVLVDKYTISRLRTSRDPEQMRRIPMI